MRRPRWCLGRCIRVLSSSFSSERANYLTLVQDQTQIFVTSAPSPTSRVRRATTQGQPGPHTKRSSGRRQNREERASADLSSSLCPIFERDWWLIQSSTYSVRSTHGQMSNTQADGCVPQWDGRLDQVAGVALTAPHPEMRRRCRCEACEKAQLAKRGRTQRRRKHPSGSRQSVLTARRARPGHTKVDHRRGSWGLHLGEADCPRSHAIIHPVKSHPFG